MGRLDCHPDGYGFVISKNSSFKEDIFVPRKKIGSALHGDTVRVRLAGQRAIHRRKGKSSLHGEIIEVVKRVCKSIVGKVYRHQKVTYVAPLDARYHNVIQIVKEDEKVLEGQIVSVVITVQPRRNQLPLGEISEVLGDPGDPEIQYKIVCHDHQIPMKFSQDILKEATQVRQLEKSDLDKRCDLRSLPTVTIDGETARDFDDAVSIERLGDGRFKLWVHIADVSHYVGAESKLDLEAMARGTSVYFPDRAIPMLPEELSNELCSLKPDVDRLTLTVVLEVGSRGEIIESKFCRSVINSDARLTYEMVKNILIVKDQNLRQDHSQLLEILEWMLELCRLLRTSRVNRGAIDFDLPEPKINYDVNGGVLDIIRAERNEAHRIIEEFMLLANEAVAQYLERQGLPLIFRVHEAPDTVKVEQFNFVAEKLGYSLQPDQRGEYTSRAFQGLMQKVAGSPEEKFLAFLMLRSFKQARYSEVNSGHFGLATNCYTHFTSPIRRYPDLVVHRLLKKVIDSENTDRKGQQLYRQLSQIAVHSTERELAAVQAERKIMRWLTAEFMKTHLGDEFEACITGFRHNGIFVQLVEHFVEGYVPIETLGGDFYRFDERRQCLIGEKTKKVFRISDRLKVRVDKVNYYSHLIEFSYPVD